MKKTSLLILLAAFCCQSAAALGAIVFNGGTYSENFDSLAGLGTTANAAYPKVTWTDDSTLPGWYANSNGATNFYLGNGNEPTDTSAVGGAGLYSLGNDASSDRALGSRASSAVGGTVSYGVRLHNNTGASIDGFALSYTVEQWKVADSAQTTLAASYAVNPADLSAAGYTAIPALNYTSTAPLSANLAGLNGNLAANQQTFSTNVSGINWAAGSDLWIRWDDVNDNGTDATAALDSLTLTPTAPGSVDPILVNATPGTGAPLSIGQSVQLTNAAAGGIPRDAATVSNLTIVQGPNGTWTQAGLNNGNLAAGSIQAGTLAFDRTGLLNGAKATGTLQFTIGAGAHGPGVGAGDYGYPLNMVVTGNTGDGSAQVAAGDSLAGLQSIRNPSQNSSIATILDGTNGRAATIISMNWRNRTPAETPPTGTTPPLPGFANGLTSDVVTVAGLSNTIFALQLTYNPMDLQAPDTTDRADEHLFLASINPSGGNWVNAVTLNTGNTATAAMQNFNGSYAQFLAANGGALTANMLGAWGVDVNNDVVWAVVDHSGQFASVPEPSSVLLAAMAGLGLIVTARRRRTRTEISNAAG